MRRWKAGLVFFAATAMLVCVALAGTCKSDEAFTAPAGQYRVENGRAVLNDGWRPTNQCGPQGCPGGTCPAPLPWQAAPPMFNLPPQQVQPQQQVSQQVHPAVCQIHSDNGFGGTGSLIDKNETLGMVLTNEHVVRGTTGEVSCKFPDGKVYKAKIVVREPSCDVAILAIQAPAIEPIEVATEKPKPGEYVVAHGWGSGQYRASAGYVIRYTHQEPPQMVQTNRGRQMIREGSDLGEQNSFSWSGKTRPGDSGSPVLDRSGRLVGLLWGGGEGSSDATPCTYVDIVAARAGRYLLPWNAKINDPARDPRNQPPVQQPPVIVQPQQPQYPPQDLGPLSAAVQDLDRRQTELERRQDTVRDTAAALAAKYEKELPGISADVKAAIEGSKAADAKAADAKNAVDEATDEDNPRGIVGRIKARLEERFGATLGEVSWLKYGGLGLVAAVIFLFVRKDIKDRKETGDPLLIEKLVDRLGSVTERTKNTVDDRVLERLERRIESIADRVAAKPANPTNP